MRHSSVLRGKFAPTIFVSLFILVTLSVVVLRFQQNQPEDPRSRAAVAALPTVDIKANGQDGMGTLKSVYIAGSPFSLAWTSTNATSCTASGTGWSGAKGGAGSVSQALAANASATYIITCSNAAGQTAQDLVSVQWLSANMIPFSVHINGAVAAGAKVNILYAPSTTPTARVVCVTGITASVTLGTMKGTCILPTTTGSYGLFAEMQNASGAYVGTSSIVTVANPYNGGTVNLTINVPPTVDIKANGQDGTGTLKTAYITASPFTLAWTSTSSTSCTASGTGWSGAKATLGSVSQVLAANTSATYSITCRNTTGQTATDSVLVQWQPASVIPFTVRVNGAIPTSSKVNIVYSVAGAPRNTCITGVAAGATVNGFCALPSTAGSYALFAEIQNASGAYIGTSNIVTVANPYKGGTVTFTVNLPPTVDIKANGQDGTGTLKTVYITASPFTLTWGSAGATSCTASGTGWSGAKAASGTASITLARNLSATYIITCTAVGGKTASDSVLVQWQPANVIPFTIRINGTIPASSKVNVVYGTTGVLRNNCVTGVAAAATLNGTCALPITAGNYSIFAEVQNASGTYIGVSNSVNVANPYTGGAVAFTITLSSCTTPAAPVWVGVGTTRTTQSTTTDKVVLDWTDVAGVASYYVDSSTNGGTSWNINGTYLPSTSTNAASPIIVAKTQSVIVRVRANNSCGGFSSWLQKTIAPLTTPPTVTKVPTVTPGGPTITTVPTLTGVQPTITTVVPTIPQGNAALNLTLLLHGIGNGGDNLTPGATGTTSPTRPQRDVTVTIYNGSNQIIKTVQGKVDYTASSGDFRGTIDAGTMTSGAYLVKVASPQYLTKFIPGIVTITTGQAIALQTIDMVTGDIDGDNKLTAALDHKILISCWEGSNFFDSAICNGRSQMADINDDGNVDQFDYNLLLREMAVQGGQ